MEKLSPFMKEYFDIKSKLPNVILLFRTGDFYEMYEEDAVVVSGLMNFNIHIIKGVKTSGFRIKNSDEIIKKIVNILGKVAIIDHGR